MLYCLFPRMITIKYLFKLCPVETSALQHSASVLVINKSVKLVCLCDNDIAILTTKGDLIAH